MMTGRKGMLNAMKLAVLYESQHHKLITNHLASPITSFCMVVTTQSPLIQLREQSLPTASMLVPTTPHNTLNITDNTVRSTSVTLVGHFRRYFDLNRKRYMDVRDMFL